MSAAATTTARVPIHLCSDSSSLSAFPILAFHLPAGKRQSQLATVWMQNNRLKNPTKSPNLPPWAQTIVSMPCHPNGWDFQDQYRAKNLRKGSLWYSYMWYSCIGRAGLGVVIVKELDRTPLVQDYAIIGMEWNTPVGLAQSCLQPRYFGCFPALGQITNTILTMSISEWDLNHTTMHPSIYRSLHHWINKESIMDSFI